MYPQARLVQGLVPSAMQWAALSPQPVEVKDRDKDKGLEHPRYRRDSEEEGVHWV